MRTRKEILYFEILSISSRKSVSVKGQTEVLWKANSSGKTDSSFKETVHVNNTFPLDGWKYDTSYRFQITHLPDTGLIKMNLYEGSTLLHQAEVNDTAEDRLRGV